MFEINSNPFIEEETIQGSKIYSIDNFYVNPDKIKEFLLTSESYLHKFDQKPSFNNIYFEDRRHVIISEDIVKVYKFLQKICNQSAPCEKLICTNLVRFKKIKFNDYENNWWWPHLDPGYNGIVYLNENDSISGTNLYQCLDLNEIRTKESTFEHFTPWRSKEKYKLIKSIKPKYNKLVLFDGKNFLHGMNICNDDYFSQTYRLNQVFFFNQNQTYYYY